MTASKDQLLRNKALVMKDRGYALTSLRRISQIQRRIRSVVRRGLRIEIVRGIVPAHLREYAGFYRLLFSCKLLTTAKG